MKLFDGWVAGIDNPLVEVYGVRSPTSDSMSAIMVGLDGKLVVHEGGVDGGVRGDVGSGDDVV